MARQLFGSYYVVPTATAIVRGWEVCPNERMRDYQALRRHALSLAFWPDGADLDWDWIKSLEKDRIGELRVGETIDGNNNVRVIVFKANKSITGDPKGQNGSTMSHIWLLTTFQKKKQGFSKVQLTAWKSIIIHRCYGGDYHA